LTRLWKRWSWFRASLGGKLLSLNRALRVWAQCSDKLLRIRRALNRLRQEAIRGDRAEQRSRSLLLTVLNEDQRRDFQKYGYFHVTGGSSGNLYRIRADSAVNIDVLGENGAVKYHLCARPIGNIPMYDVMAGQMLFLQDSSTEPRFLEQANRHVMLSFAAMGRWQER
jgi:hypothetical protein